MSALAQLLAECDGHGIRLVPTGDGLTIDAPRDTLTPDLLDRLSNHKPALLAIAEDQVPSTKAPDPYMHIFLDAGMGNVLAFFELPNSPDMGRDEATPEWVQHIAFEVEDEPALLAAKSQIESHGIDVLGPTHHGIFKSIYFFDPNGHRLELAANIDQPGDLGLWQREEPVV